MKKVTTILAVILLTAVGAVAQKLSYSAVVRNSANDLVSNKNITVAVSITNSADGPAVYSETHTVQTDLNGLVSLTIGNGTDASGSMSDVTWNTAFITTTYTIPGDPTPSVNTMPVNAVPYALYAEKAGNSSTGSAHVSDGNVTISMPISDFVSNLSDDEKAELLAALGCTSGGGDEPGGGGNEPGGGDEPGGGNEPTTFTCGTSTVTDIDNNTYHTVQIGNQCWLKENMRATHYSPNLANAPTLYETTTGAADDIYALYSAPGSTGTSNSDPSLVSTYGLLYNGFAAFGGWVFQGGVQGICPDGWHIPTTNELQTMLTAAGISNATPANNLTTGTWNPSDEPGAPGNTSEQSNTSGFSALPAGYFSYHYYEGLKAAALFWTSTMHIANSEETFDYLMLAYDGTINILSLSPLYGMSVRCVKDN